MWDFGIYRHFVVDFENGYVIMDGMEPSNDNSFGSFGVSGGGGGVPSGANPVNVGVNPVNAGVNSSGVNPGVVNPQSVNPGVVNPQSANPGGVNPPSVNPGGVSPVNADMTPGGAGMTPGGAGVNPGSVGVNPVNTGGMNMNYTMPVGFGTGDIVIGEEKSTKSRKWLVVCGVMIGVVVLGLLGWFVAKSIMKNGVSSTGDLKQSFNKFANYVLSGEELTTEISPELDVFYGYYFTDETYTDEEKVTINKKAEDLFTDFEKVYIGVIDKEKITSNDEMLIAFVSDSEKILDFLSVIYMKPRIEVEKIADVYISGGSDSVQEYVDSYYDALSGNQYYEEYKNATKKWAGLLVQSLELYNKAGCIVDGKVNWDCQVASNDTATVMEERIMDYLDVESTLDSYNKNRSKNLVLKVFVMNALINDGDVSKYVTTGGGMQK